MDRLKSVDTHPSDPPIIDKKIARPLIAWRRFRAIKRLPGYRVNRQGTFDRAGEMAALHPDRDVTY